MNHRGAPLCLFHYVVQGTGGRGEMEVCLQLARASVDSFFPSSYSGTSAWGMLDHAVHTSPPFKLHLTSFAHHRLQQHEASHDGESSCVPLLLLFATILTLAMGSSSSHIPLYHTLEAILIRPLKEITNRLVYIWSRICLPNPLRLSLGISSLDAGATGFIGLGPRSKDGGMNPREFERSSRPWTPATMERLLPQYLDHCRLETV
ncbi:hypothetical protein BC827DRAFT_159187 [Russula dissimulans]|nr:hypothetical protein BC827DRAFT_159187 [Russula dissimulans]